MEGTLVVKIIGKVIKKKRGKAGLSKDEEKRLRDVLKHTQGTMPIDLVVHDRGTQEAFEKAKKGRKWSNLVEIVVEPK